MSAPFYVICASSCSRCTNRKLHQRVTKHEKVGGLPFAVALTKETAPDVTFHCQAVGVGVVRDLKACLLIFESHSAAYVCGSPPSWHSLCKYK